MRVHTSYIDQFTNPTFTPPSSSPSSEEQPWYIAAVDRTRWYDLLCVQDRVEAFVALWRVMAYLARVEPVKGEMEEERAAREK